MSGTSMDGTDACLVRLSEDYSFEILDSFSLEYKPELRKKLLEVAVGNGTVQDVCFLNFIVGEHFAKCANELVKKSGMKKSDILLRHMSVSSSE